VYLNLLRYKDAGIFACPKWTKVPEGWTKGMSVKEGGFFLFYSDVIPAGPVPIFTSGGLWTYLAVDYPAVPQACGTAGTLASYM